MDANEQQLISGLFGRMREMQGIDKDAAAADLIAQEVQSNPDAPYLLTQSVLVQEQALQRADQRIKELEAQVDEMRRGADAMTASTSVPQAGAVPAAGRGRPMGAPHQMRSGAAAANENRDPGQQGRAGGFMAQAMTTAAGVAGGMLLASGISSLFSGSSAEAGTTDASGAQTAEATPSETPAAETANADAQNEDPALQDAAAEDEFGHGDDVHDASFEDDWGDFGDLDI